MGGKWMKGQKLAVPMHLRITKEEEKFCLARVKEIGAKSISEWLRGLIREQMKAEKTKAEALKRETQNGIERREMEKLDPMGLGVMGKPNGKVEAKDAKATTNGAPTGDPAPATRVPDQMVDQRASTSTAEYDLT